MSGGGKIIRAAFVVMAATLVGRVVGFVREMAVAQAFGASMETDAILVAFTIPSMAAMALAGAFNSAFIPVFSGYLDREDRAGAHRMASTLINLLAIILAVIIIVALFFAPQLAGILARGFKPQALALTTELMKVIFPGLIFIGLMGLAGGILNSYRHFLVPALGPMVASIGIIAAIKLLAPELGIMSYAIGILAGYGGQFLVQLPAMARKGFRYYPVLDLKHPGVRRTLVLMLPILVGAVISQVILLVERRLGSYLISGSISHLNYASRIFQLPWALFGTAITVPLFPALAAQAARREFGELRQTLARGINTFALLLAPAAVALIVLRVPIVRLLFERGEFNARDTVATALALALYSLGLFPFAAKDVLNRAFYALQDTLTPVILAAVSVAINIVLDIALVRMMGVGGLALGSALATAINMVLLYGFLSRKLGGLALGENLLTVGKVIAAALIMAPVTYFTGSWLENVLDTGARTGQLLQIGITGAAGVLVYTVVIMLLRVPELEIVAGMVRGYFQRRQPKTAD
ncbi:MAG: murein biosynthesis integral membrane protein MurJ [Bacillota bacterium]